MDTTLKGPLISVVLPTYNGSEFLDQAIAGIVGQTLENWELIVVDDCSTDATSDIAQSWAEKDARIRCHRNSVNKKLPASLNEGFQMARGEFLTWTSDDNVFHPEALDKMAARLEQNPEVGMVYCDYRLIDEQGTAGETYRVQPRDKLAEANCVGACFLYRRKVYEEIGPYNESLLCAEDYDYWLRVSSRFEMLAVNEVLYDYRLRRGSMTDVYGAPHIHDKARAALEANLPSLSWLKGKARAQAHFRLAVWRYDRGDLSQARGHFIRSLRRLNWTDFKQHRRMIARLLLGSLLGGLIERVYLAGKGRNPAT